MISYQMPSYDTELLASDFSLASLGHSAKKPRKRVDAIQQCSKSFYSLQTATVSLGTQRLNFQVT